ncbi:hypothetical protein [Lacihabitans soyangensis]|uniref:hypothetical protein n=1 Tax=Lacihabitans soyangensis TaxID=869394 RepID=UPI0020CCEED7|nr:hypothetical protein [Lacihabitans soyangensis]
MKSKKNIKLPLTDLEKAILRKNKIKIADILAFATDELDLTQQPNGKKKNVS